MDDQKIIDLQAKIAAIQKDNKVDLSSEEDLSIAIMNLISLEEHFFFSGAKTGKGEYFDLLNETREIRKSLLAKLMDENEAESWCISKHLLAATMRLMEVGTKYQKDGKKEEADKIFKQAFHIYSMFWALRLKIIDTAGIKKIDDDKLNVHDEKGNDQPWTTEDIVNKLVNCCKE
jgi:hypothetical protein